MNDDLEKKVKDEFEPASELEFIQDMNDICKYHSSQINIIHDILADIALYIKYGYEIEYFYNKTKQIYEYEIIEPKSPNKIGY